MAAAVVRGGVVTAVEQRGVVVVGSVWKKKGESIFYLVFRCI